MQWQCGDSFFTKYSSCSFDRAANDASHLLNPLHPSITPCGSERATSKPTTDTTRAPRGPQLRSKTGSQSGGPKPRFNRNSGPSSSTLIANGPTLSRPTLPPINATPHADMHLASRINSATTGEVIPFMPLSEVGKASRFGDKTLGENNKCNVFEVVLQTKEQTMCPACVRSPKRARLPAHARGCFGLS
jgi:hypothetical protein